MAGQEALRNKGGALDRADFGDALLHLESTSAAWYTTAALPHEDRLLVVTSAAPFSSARTIPLFLAPPPHSSRTPWLPVSFCTRTHSHLSPRSSSSFSCLRESTTVT